MFYLLSKVFWFCVVPSHIVLWLVVATAVLLLLKRERPARRCAIAAAAILFGFSLTPAGVWLMHPLENAYPRPALPQHIDGILILGGGTNWKIAGSRNSVPDPSYGMTRLAAGYVLARQHPEARVVFSSGILDAPKDKSEAALARKTLLDLGLAPDRLVLETSARNTRENFTYSRALVNPKPGETWVVVTSAFHMPRTMAIAAKVNWTVIPWPSDYQTATNSHFHLFDLPANLECADMAVHEGIGLLVYRLTGKAS